MTDNVSQCHTPATPARTADARISMRLPAVTLHALTAAASADGRSLSNYLLRVLDDHLSNLRGYGR